MNTKKLLGLSLLLTLPLLRASAYDCEVDGLKYILRTNTYGEKYALVAAPDEENIVLPEGGFRIELGETPENWPLIKDGRQAYGMKEITIPKSITYEGEIYKIKGLETGALMYEPALERIILPPDGCITLYAYNLIECPNLREIINSATIYGVSDGCFVNLPMLNNGKETDGAKSQELIISGMIGSYSFRNCGAEHIRVGSATEISSHSFSNMPNLKSVAIEACEIGDDVFCNCPQLEEVDFRNNDGGPWSIGSSFKNNASLKRVFFERSMEWESYPLTLYDDAFHGCPALEEVYIDRGQIVIAEPPFAGGEISPHATLFTARGSHRWTRTDPAWSYIHRIVELPFNMTGRQAPDYCVTDIGTDYLTVEWEPVAEADGYYYTIMQSSKTTEKLQVESDFRTRTVPEAWKANNIAWTDDPEKCCAEAPSFLFEKSGDYIDFTVRQEGPDGTVINRITDLEFKARPYGRFADLYIYAINGDRKDLLRVYYLANDLIQGKTATYSINCSTDESLPYDAEYIRVEFEGHEGVTATIDNVYAIYQGALTPLPGTYVNTPLGNRTDHTFNYLNSAHRYHIEISALKDDGTYQRVACAPLVRTLTAPAGINDTESDTDGNVTAPTDCTVYNLMGQPVMRQATEAEAAASLAPGIYILNGKKFIVR